MQVSAIKHGLVSPETVLDWLEQLLLTTDTSIRETAVHYNSLDLSKAQEC